MSNFLEDSRKNDFEYNRDLLQKNLYIIRKAAGWSAEVLAEKIGVTKKTILKYETDYDNNKMNKPVFISIMTILYDKVKEDEDSNKDNILSSVLGLIFESKELTDENRATAECFISGLKSKKGKEIDTNLATDGLKKIVGVSSIVGVTAVTLLTIIKKIIK